MNGLTDDRLHAAFREYARTIEPPPDLHQEAVRGAHAARRRRRGLQAGLTVAVAAVVTGLVVAVAASVWTGQGQSAPPLDKITTSPSPTPTQTEDEAREKRANLISYRWARDLPRGDDARVVFTYDGVLYAGDQRVPLPPTVEVNGYIFEPSVSAVLPDGWVTSARAPDEPERSRTGILAPDGTFTPFAHQYVGKSDRGCVAPSPDDTRLVLGMDVVTLPTGEQVGEIPTNSRYCDVWTNEGLVYPDRTNQMWLWDGTGEPKQLPLEGRSLRSDGYGAAYRKGCTSVFRLQPDAKIETVAEMCGVHGSSLSPNAEQILTDDYDIYAVTTQRLIQRLNVPDELRGSLHTPVWEDNTSVVFNVTNWDWYRRNGEIVYDGYLVRCSVTDGECERASDKFTSRSGAPQVVLPLDADDPYEGP